jgi:hypothetical protein
VNENGGSFVRNSGNNSYLYSEGQNAERINRKDSNSSTEKNEFFRRISNHLELNG